MESYSDEELSKIKLSNTQKLETLPLELYAQIEKPPAGDERIAAFSAAMITELQDEETRDFIKDLFAHRKDIAPSYAANLLLRGFQKQLLRDADRFDYPTSFDKTEPWRAAIREVLEDPVRSEELVLDMFIRDVQSNIAERYKSFKLIMQAMKSRIGERPKVMDIGCSQNQGLKKLALGRPFGEVEVVNDGEGESIIDPNLTKKVNAELAKPFRIGTGLGIDIMPMNDPRVREWAKSCSFYPSELLDQELIDEYDLINQHDRVDNIGFDTYDFTSEALYRLSHDQFRGNFDVITLSTVMYQMDEDERTRMADIVRRFLAPGGIVIYQDFGEVDKGDPTKLNYYKHWFLHKFSYTTAVLDTADPRDELQEIFRWENGRCQRMAMGLGSLSINGKLKTYPEIIAGSK